MLALPLTVACDVLARLEYCDAEVMMRDATLCCDIFGMQTEEVAAFYSSALYRKMRFQMLLRGCFLREKLKSGLAGRVRQYNQLVSRGVIRSPQRFALFELSPPLTHFLRSVDDRDQRRVEPAYYYPIDEAAVDFWNRVHETGRILLRYKLDRFLRTRNTHHGENCGFWFEQCSAIIAVAAFRMEHQFARALLIQHLSLTETSEMADESKDVPVGLVRSKVAFFDKLSQ